MFYDQTLNTELEAEIQSVKNLPSQMIDSKLYNNLNASFEMKRKRGKIAMGKRTLEMK